MIEMTVAGIAVDARSGHPIVVLNDPGKRRALPIWIGVFEAHAITRALENFKPERPMTHDLLLNTITQMGYKVKHIEINEISSNTYFATIVLTNSGSEETRPIDARPSDAIALALRAGAPIFVSPEVVREATIPADNDQDEKDAEEFHHFVEGLKASDFQAALEGEAKQKDKPAKPKPAKEKKDKPAKEKPQKSSKEETSEVTDEE